MQADLDNSYFFWLGAKVLSDDNVAYTRLMEELYNTAYAWSGIPGDDSRVEDGKELRIDYARQFDMRLDKDWLDLPCSVLEMLIAFSRRAEFQTGMTAREWFWIFIENLGLNDPFISKEASDEILFNFVWRQYSFDGTGGLFPIPRTDNDQTKIEIWYQFFEYIEDQGLI